MGYRLRRWVPVCAWMGVIIFFSHQSDSGEHSSSLLQTLLAGLGLHYSPETVDDLHWGMRKLAHISEYAVLAVLSAWAIAAPPPALYWRAWLLGVSFAMSDECHQHFVPHRVGAWQDVVIDSFGALVGVVVVLVWRWLRAWRGY